MSSSPSRYTAPSSLSFWAALRHSFRGGRSDFTSGGIGRAIVLLAIPMVLEMLMQSIFAVVDIFFVGRLGADAVSAVGITESILILVFAIGIGLGMATAAMVARRIGEGDEEGAGVAAFQAFLVTAAISIPIAFVGVFFSEDLLLLMGATPGIVAEGTTYCAILFGFNLIILLLFVINAIFRGAGDAVLAMKTLWLANALNIMLDPLLIFGLGPFPELGVAGAATATTIGRGVGLMYQIYVMRNGNGHIRLSRAFARLNRDVMRRMLRLAGPGMLQYLVGTASWMALFRIIAGFGSDAVAGYTIALRIILFALLPSWGVANAAATLVGQNLGARQPERAERSVRLAGIGNMVFLGSVAALLFFRAESLVRIFSDEAAVVAYGVQCLEIVSYTYTLFALGSVSMQAFNGAGDTTTPTWINVFAYWVLQIPLAYVLSKPLGMGPKGVFTAIAVAQAALAIISTFLFRLGYWKEKVV